MASGISQVFVSTDQKWYAYEPSTKTVYWVLRDTLEMLAICRPSTLSTVCIKSFTVTPSQKVVLATCSGLYVWLGYWLQFDTKNAIFVRAYDDYFVYAIESSARHPYQIPISRGIILLVNLYILYIYIHFHSSIFYAKRYLINFGKPYSSVIIH